MEKTAIIIPALNEEKTIGEVVEESKKHGSVIVVDDGSEDGTSEIAQKKGAIVLKQPVNMGVGFSTLTGFEYVRGKGFDYVVTIDGDGQHDPRVIPLLLKELKKGYDAVFTYREKDESMPMTKKIGNHFLTLSTNIICGKDFKDTQSGLKAFTRKALNKLDLNCDDYTICSEICVEVADKGLKYSEIKIPTIYDDFTKYKGTDLVTGVRIVLNLMKLRFLKWR